MGWVDVTLLLLPCPPSLCMYTFFKKTESGELFHRTLENRRIVIAFKRLSGKDWKEKHKLTDEPNYWCMHASLEIDSFTSVWCEVWMQFIYFATTRTAYFFSISLTFTCYDNLFPTIRTVKFVYSKILFHRIVMFRLKRAVCVGTSIWSVSTGFPIQILELDGWTYAKLFFTLEFILWQVYFPPTSWFDLFFVLFLGPLLTLWFNKIRFQFWNPKFKVVDKFVQYGLASKVRNAGIVTPID